MSSDVLRKSFESWKSQKDLEPSGVSRKEEETVGLCAKALLAEGLAAQRPLSASCSKPTDGLGREEGKRRDRQNLFDAKSLGKKLPLIRFFQRLS